MDESKSILLDALFNTFGTDSMLKPFMGEITDSVLRKCFDVLNVNFFSSKLKAIPLMYVSDSEARRFLASRDVKEDEIPNMFFGVHSVLYDNDPIKLKWNDTLILHDDVILLNKKHIGGKSISFLTACLCHEMIHYYDRMFGEYCDFIKYILITGTKKNMHNTMTFETMKDQARDVGINVIQEIQEDKDAEILDKEGIELLFRKAKENGLVLEGEERLRCDTGGIAFSKTGKGGSINTF